MLEDGTHRYTYDKEGNRIEKYVGANVNDTLDAGDTSVMLLDWDHRNRLVKVTQQTNFGTDTRILTYEYDAFDRRVVSHTLSLSTGLPARSTYWVWDGEQMALQFNDGDGGGPNAAFLAYRFLSGPRIDQVFHQEGTATSHWLLADHLGTTRDVVDDSGALVRHYVFDSYGNLAGSTAHTLIMFAGREYDSLTGLYYVRARWYDPAVGRWTSEDPIGFAGGDTNLSRYVGNSPVNYTDPSGLRVLIAARDLHGFAVGTHQFILIWPENPDDFTDIALRRRGLGGIANRVRLVDIGRGLQGFVLGAHNVNGHLQVVFNQETDLRSVRESIDPENYPPGLSD